MNTIPAVFISSTSRDLALYRDRVKDIILRMEMFPIAMEEFSPTQHHALQLCYDKVQKCDIFVGIYAHRYGYIPPSEMSYATILGDKRQSDGETGITHLEYLWALERGIPMLLFVISDKDAHGQPVVIDRTYDDEQGLERLQQFKTHIMSKHVVGSFYSPDHLASLVATGLSKQTPRPDQPIIIPPPAPDLTLIKSDEGNRIPLTDFPKTPRGDLLRKAYEYWVVGMFEVAVEESGTFDLGLGMTPQSVLRHREYGDLSLPNDTSNILPVFHLVHRRLLILGAPGSGKTFLLLQLGRELIRQAIHDERKPMPVVFNLSSWGTYPQPLDEWIISELRFTYQIPSNTARDWVVGEKLLLLLDGLDEVAEENRDACVDAINHFRAQYRSVEMAVCSRIGDYEKLTQKLDMDSAITLHPLTEPQIEAYLSHPDYEGVRTFRKQDDTLREMSKTPVLLNIMAIAYRGMGATTLTLPSDQSGERARRNHIMEEFFHKSLRNAKIASAYPPKQIRHYLGWLGARMLKYSHTVFYPELLQPDWMQKRGQRRMYELLTNLLTVLLIGGCGVAILGTWFFIPVILFALVSVYIAVSEQVDKPLSDIRLQPNSLRLSITREMLSLVGFMFLVNLIYFGGASMLFGIIGVQIAFILMVIFLANIAGIGLFIFVPAVIGGILANISGIIVASIAFIPFLMLEVQQRTTSTKPQEGIQSAIYRTLAYIGLGIISSIISILLLGWQTGIYLGLFSTIMFVAISLMQLIDHILLRYILAFSKDAPLNYKFFLTWATQNGFTRRLGAGFAFRHRYLTEFFTSLAIEELVPQVNHPDAKKRAIAVRQLGYLGEPATNLLQRSAQDSDEQVRKIAEKGLLMVQESELHRIRIESQQQNDIHAEVKAIQNLIDYFLKNNRATDAIAYQTILIDNRITDDELAWILDTNNQLFSQLRDQKQEKAILPYLDKLLGLLIGHELWESVLSIFADADEILCQNTTSAGKKERLKWLVAQVTCALRADEVSRAFDDLYRLAKEGKKESATETELMTYARNETDSEAKVAYLRNLIIYAERNGWDTLLSTAIGDLITAYNTQKDYILLAPLLEKSAEVLVKQGKSATGNDVVDAKAFAAGAWNLAGEFDKGLMVADTLLHQQGAIAPVKMLDVYQTYIYLYHDMAYFTHYRNYAQLLRDQLNLVGSELGDDARKRSLALTNLYDARMLHRTGDLEQAKELYLKSMQSYRELGDIFLVSAIYRNLASLEWVQSHDTDMVAYLEQAIDALGDSTDGDALWVRVLAQVRFADYHLHQQNWDEAQRYLDLVDAYLQAYPKHASARQEWAYRRGLLALIQGDMQTAETVLASGRMGQYQATIAILQGTLYAQLGDMAQAQIHFEFAYQELVQLRALLEGEGELFDKPDWLTLALCGLVVCGQHDKSQDVLDMCRYSMDYALQIGCTRAYWQRQFAMRLNILQVADKDNQLESVQKILYD